MPADIAQPVSLSPYAGTHADLRVQLDTHLEVPLQLRRGDGIAVGHGARALECGIHDHGLVIALLRRLDRGGLHGRPVHGFMKDWVIRVMLFHRREVVRAFEQVLSLTRGVFGANRLAVDALCRETLEGARGQYNIECACTFTQEANFLVEEQRRC